MDPSVDSDWKVYTGQDSDPDNSPKMKIAVVIGSIIIIAELIYFTQFSGIKIPFPKFPEMPMITLIIFMRSLKKPTPTPTSPPLPTKIPTPTLIPINENLNTVEYEGIITSINSSQFFISDPKSETDKIKFSFNLEIGETKSAIYNKTLFFNQIGVEAIKVFDETKKIIFYKDLKVGQKIKIIERRGLPEIQKNSIEIYIL